MIRSLPPVRREAVLAGALVVAALVELWLAPVADDDRWRLFPLAFVLPLSLLWRVRLPLSVLAANLAGWVAIDTIGITTASGESADPVMLGLTLGIAVYSVGAHTRPGVPTVGGLALVAAMVLLGTLSEDQSDFGDVIFFSVVFGGVWVAGRAIRRRRHRERDLIVQRDEGARAAVAEERTRIARELHDVVAHAISVIVLQARGARHALGRIVQEALTNALKHAGPARARVLVRYGEDVLELEVADTGEGAVNGSGGGHGLAGMRERVAVFGGELESGPRSDGGYAVRARLPL